jgi:CubicO group peptidase (beta-lactamase class C family)
MTRRVAPVLLAALLLVLRGLAAEAQRAPLNGLDAYVSRAMRDWEIPGLAIAIVKDDSVVFLKGYGVRQLGKSAAVDERTLFAIGSTTKAMTAAAIGMLVDEGKVGWDDQVTTHLSSFQLHDPYVTRELRVRDLLTHRSGLPGADLLWAGADYSTSEILRRLRYLEPATSLRTRFAYQNVMYAAAGEVIASASGMPWETFMRTRIFAPLGMRSTLPTAATLGRQPNVAQPHMRLGDTIRLVANRTVDPVAPAGAVWSSISDMAKWMRFVLDSGRASGTRLIAAATFAELLTPQVVVPPEEFYPTAKLARPHFTLYGLGWFLQDYRGRAVAMHTGSIDGMSAIIGLIPDQRLGVYVLANLDHAELRHALMYHVFDLYNPPASRDWSVELLRLYGDLREQGRAAERKKDSSRVTGTAPSHALARFAGTYVDSLYGGAVVTYAGGRLHLRLGNAFDGDLEHWHYDTFRARWKDPTAGTSLVSFSLDATGAPVKLEIEGVGRDFRRPASEDR